MARVKDKPLPCNLAQAFRGLYARVASSLSVDRSFVSRVARGERQSKEVEAAVERETRQIIKMLKANHNGIHRASKQQGASNHNGASRNGARRASKSTVQQQKP